VGSVSGGCVEGAVIEAALEVMSSGKPRTLDFGVSDEEAWAVGLACGGKVSIYVEAVDDQAAALLSDLERDREQRRSAVLATTLADGKRQLLHPMDAPSGTGALDTAAREALVQDRSSVVETPGGDVFLQAQNPALRLVVVGAVHITQALAPMAAALGFEVTVVDPRTAWAAAARFPDVNVVQSWPNDVLAEFGIDHRTAVVTFSHDPKLDDPALEAALRSKAFYIGALGSRRTHAKRLARLAERGFTEAELARIHAPIGLDIGAISPAEIALSTLAQVVERLRVPAEESAGA
jgi:xanthine dehydrogenase accessory factor